MQRFFFLCLLDLVDDLDEKEDPELEVAVTKVWSIKHFLSVCSFLNVMLGACTKGEGILETEHIVIPPLSIGLTPSKVIIFLLRQIRRQKLY